MNFNHTQFMGVINNSTKRAALINSINRWYRDERLDGIDIDFEHPASQAEANGLGVFISELRDTLGPRAASSCGRWPVRGVCR